MSVAVAPQRYRVFERYEVIRRLGTGGMGELYLAQEDLGGGRRRLVVLKSLRPKLATDPSFVRQFLNESRILSELTHPHIVRVLDVGEFEGNYFIAMEHIAGGSLLDLLRRAGRGEAVSRMPTSLSLRVVAQAALGLDYAHHVTDHEGRPLRVVHRDLNPNNIMVSLEGVTKVIDFGVAMTTMHERETKEGIVKGTLGYLSPEQLAQGTVDHRSDQFQLGIVLWELLVGRPLYHAKSPIEAIRKISAGNPEAPSRYAPHLAPALDDICLRMMARAPEDRFVRLRDAALAIEDVVQREGWSDDDHRPYIRELVGALVEERIQPQAGPLLMAGISTQRERCRLCGSMERASSQYCSQCGAPREGALPAHPAPSRPTTGLSVVPFVGRGYELARAGALIREAAIGLSRVLVFTGASGLGKSELLRRSADLGRAARLKVIEVHGRGRPGAPPYDLVWQLFDDNVLDEARVRARVAAANLDASDRERVLHALLGDPLRSSMAVDHAELSIRAAFRRLLIGWARAAGGLCILVDDLDLLDPASLDLLRSLAARADTEPLAILGTADASFSLGILSGVALRALGPKDRERLVRMHLGGEEATPLLQEAIHRVAEGNPGVIVDLLDQLRRSGALAREHGQWTLAAGQRVAGSARQLMATMIDRLPPAAREVAELVALSGLEAPRSLLDEAWSLDEPILPALQACEEAGLIIRTGAREPAVRFVRALARTVLRGRLTPVRARSLHTALGEAWGHNLDSDPDAAVARAAHLAAGEADAFDADAALEAARQLAARGARATAGHFYGQTLRRLLAGGRVEPRDIPLTSGLLLEVCAQPDLPLPPGTATLLEEALEKSGDQLPAHARRRAVLVLARLFRASHRSRQAAALIDGELGREGGPPELEVELKLELARACRRCGRPEQAEELVEELRASIPKLGPPEPWRQLDHLGCTLLTAGDIERAYDVLVEAAQATEAHPGPAPRFRTWRHLARAAAEGDRVDEADAILSHLLHDAQALDDDAAVAIVHRERALLAAGRGDRAAARGALEAALLAAQRVGWIEEVKTLRSVLEETDRSPGPPASRWAAMTTSGSFIL